MMKFNLYRKLLISMAFILSTLVGCSKESPITPQNLNPISGVVIPLNTAITSQGDLTITGNGFENGDVIFLESNGVKCSFTTKSITYTTIVATALDILNENIVYKVYLKRANNTQYLGSTKIVRQVIADIQIDPTNSSTWGDIISISGKGFTNGDKIYIRQNGMKEAKVDAITSTGLKFIVPINISAGVVDIILLRDNSEYLLGSATFNMKLATTVIDKTGASIKGMIYSGGKGLEGVLVSDGDKIETTDANGHYWIASSKRNKQVFVILPSGYQPIVENSQPKFWATCKQSPSVVEQHNFELYNVNNDNHTTIVFTDLHLANRNTPKDYVQFRAGLATEVKSIYNTYKENVYCLNLGDFSWDQYWYINNWGLSECLNELNEFSFPVFNAMGNHDNNPYINGDFVAEDDFRSILGPKYYSMNLGKIHYIILDNIIWTSTGGAQGTVGSRTYSNGLDNDQFEWLKKDLEKISDKSTPIVLGFHIPTISPSGVSNGDYTYSDVSSGMKRVLDLLRDFQSVEMLTGHTHVNRFIEIPGYNNKIREHNIVAGSATWWWTNQYANNNIATDGSPGGYKVFEVRNRDISWHTKGVGLDRNKQFICYDMNKVKEYWATNSQALKAFAFSDYASRANDYSGVGENEVFINIWACEHSRWSINVMENGRKLSVTPVWTKDPLHTISYDIPRRIVASDPNFTSTYSSHIYSVKASSPNSTLEIEVTDSFGVKYKETMIRPKTLTFNVN